MSIFEKRRVKLFELMSKQAENSVVIVPGHPELIRNHDVHFKFRQDSNLFFLTGFTEPDAIAVFRNIRGKKDFILFVNPKDLAKEIWTGYRAGVEGAVSKFGASRAYSVAEFDSVMETALEGADRIYYQFFNSLNRNGVEYLDQKILRLMNLVRLKAGRTGKGMAPLFDVSELLGDMRLFKSPEEIQLMKKASDISARAHTEAMARTKPGLYEYQIEALLEFVFTNEGCARHGYPSIVASGINSTILHYVENNHQLKDGDLLLIDAGGEFEYYTSDITRTFPVNGKFTSEQKELYKITLDVQKECINLAKPGMSMFGIHSFAVGELTKAMIALKFIQGMSLQQAVETSAYKKYYPHGTGHFLGMDVHDIGLYQKNGEPRKLEAGMAFTIEPGFYVLHDDLSVPEKYRGIGIRIEDDVIITPSGCDVLTSGVPKEMDEMCSMIGSKKWISLS